jgi:hypothetical protein
MKSLRTCLAVAGLAALSLGLPAHHAGPPGRATARGVAAGRADGAVLPVEFSTDGGELMVARLAYESGNYLLNKARQAEPAAARRLLKQADQHYRACLAHENRAPDAGSLFADARRNLETARKLLEAAAKDRAPPAPAPSKKADAAPRVARAVPKSAEAVAPRRASAPAAEGLMVGPDGVIYHRAAGPR